MNITEDGQKHLGGFVGTEAAVNKYIHYLVDNWVAQSDDFRTIAKHKYLNTTSAED